MAAVSVPTKFVQPPNAHLICSLCKGLFKDPVINVRCGHTFCKECILRQSFGDNQAKCPQDDLSCDIQSLVVNRSLQSQVEDLLIYCRHALLWSEEEGDYMLDPEGCHSKIKLGERDSHELACVAALVPCPNSNKCGLFRRRDLSQHLSMCQAYSCPHSSKGCVFSGSQSALTQHLPLCGHRGLSPGGGSPDDLYHSLQTENKTLRDLVTGLETRVSKVEQENSLLHSQLTLCQSQLSELGDKYESVKEQVDRLTAAHRQSPSSPVSPPASPAVSGESGIRPVSPLRRSSSSSSSTSRLHYDLTESWAMPFQFKCIGTLRSHKSGVFDLQTHKSKLFSAGGDNVIKIWDLEALAKGCTQALEGHTAKIQCLAIGRQYLYSAGDDLSLRAWCLDKLTQVTVIEQAHEKTIAALTCSKDYVFSSSHTIIKVWDSMTLECVHSITGLKHWVRCLALNSAQDRLYSGSHNTIEIWDATGKFNLAGKITHTHGSIYSLAITHQFIIAGTYNMNTHLFDVVTQHHVQKLSGHVGTITSLAVTKNGKFMFTGSTDAQIQVWSLENFLPIQPLSRHDDAVNVVTLHNDLLLSGSDDTEIKIYKYFKMQMGFVPT